MFFLKRVRKMEPKQDSVLRSAFLRMVLDDKKLLGFESEEEAAYLCLNLVLAAADTVI